jgi:transposase
VANGRPRRAWLADVIARIANHPAGRLDELLPWHWRKEPTETAAAA